MPVRFSNSPASGRAKSGWFSGTPRAPTAVLVVQRATVGVWDAFFKTQEHYGHGVHNPMVAIVRQVNLAVTSPKHPIVSIQTLLFIAIALAMVHGTATRGRLGLRLDSPLVVFLLVHWPFPFLIGGMVTNRSGSPLLPCALLLRNVPRTLQVFVLVVTIFIDYEMVGLFYQGNLVQGARPDPLPSVHQDVQG